MKFKKLTLNEGIFDMSDVDQYAYYGWGEGAYWELHQASTNKSLLERDCTEVVYDLDSEIGKLNRPDEIFSTLGEQAIEFLVDKFDIEPEEINLDDFEIIVYSDSYTDSCKLADLRNDLKYMF